MKQNELVNTILKKVGITSSELSIVIMLTMGLVVGTIYNNFIKENIKSNLISSDALNNTLDSLSELEKTTFVGSNIENEPVPELAKADTIVKPNTFTQQKINKKDFKGIVNINKASKTQLMQLYKIGEKTAEKIIEYRLITPFVRKEDIIKVKGIGPKTFEQIKDNISVE
ncbi:hypothetical protein SDC9_167149 [bioreactor metagenome]|uniref:Helix-hairpin-helix DNA-binding motif class 1 domain-containing protein n=1 Tax=bioreactor metagenome TaxID=1076179 RepID=A0A645FZ11_9ZZZZ